MVDIFYDKPSGSAYSLASSVRGKVCLYHVNLEGAKHFEDFESGQGAWLERDHMFFQV